ncbi:MAG: hypothetical protein Q8P67_28800 [archaeon]|nr:hypothetical protein [archaeon]
MSKMIKVWLVMAMAMMLGSADGERSQYEFALQFISQPVGNVNHATAVSQQITTQIGESGPMATVSAVGGGKALWLSETVGPVVDNHWREVGNITFGGAGTVLFESNGYSGVQMADFADLNYGAITYRITGGTGGFFGAYGMMVDMFVSTQPNNATAPFFIQAAGQFWIDQ